MRILILGDIHIGSIRDTNYVYNVIQEILDKELVFNKTDAVILNGDYFHRLFKVNEEYTTLSINIMSYIITLCKKNRTKIRIIYGTESHEASQYKLFNYHLTESDIDMKIIYTVTEEELFPNVRVLYIPEEYIESKKSHYKKYLYSNKHYNYIFGHGVISEGMPMIQFDESRPSEKKVPHFRSKELSSISDICVFNHYHVYTDMGDHCYYLGSLFRDSFGEENNKGYGIIENDQFVFVENSRAYLYKTYTYEEDSDLYIDPENIARELKKLKAENQDIFDGTREGKIRIVMKLPPDIDVTFKETIRTMIFNDKHISPLIKESSEVIQEAQETVTDEYDFILDASLNVTDKIHQYIQKQYESDMTLNDLHQYIHGEFKA